MIGPLLNAAATGQYVRLKNTKRIQLEYVQATVRRAEYFKELGSDWPYEFNRNGLNSVNECWDIVEVIS